MLLVSNLIKTENILTKKIKNIEAKNSYHGPRLNQNVTMTWIYVVCHLRGDDDFAPSSSYG